MSTALERQIHDAMTKFLIDRGLKDVAKVTGFTEFTESGGYCDTCWYEEIVVKIAYDKITGGSHTYTYYGNFADLIRALS